MNFSMYCGRVLLCLLLAFQVLTRPAPADTDSRPNILWFVVDDMSANFSCYGETAIQTPTVDRLAEEGVRFTRAYATAPVCSPFRSALITGMYQTTIGAHHHRSGRGKHRIQLPPDVRPIPVYFQQAGYWTCNGSGLPGFDGHSRPVSKPRPGKTDYNFDWDKSMYDSHDWAGRQPGQPFFMQVQLHGGKLRGASEKSYTEFENRVRSVLGETTPPEKVKLPPYYPDDPVLLRDWATYLDSVRMTDWHVEKVLERLQKEGLLEQTLIVFFTDHGISHARGKQFLYDEGTHIPLVIRGPGVAPGTVRDDLIEHIDIAALSLAAAGINIPPSMQGDDILSADYQPHPFVFAARDRCGEAVDRIRSVRSDRFLYIRNFYPQRPLLQPSQYKDSKLILIRLRELHASGRLPELSERLLFAATRPPEELYEYRNDGWQINNLAADPRYADELSKHRQQLNHWIVSTGDKGPEPRDVWEQEMRDEMEAMNPDSERYRTFSANVELYRQWFYAEP